MRRQDYKRKLEQWEAEGYEVSDLRQKWFPAKKGFTSAWFSIPIVVIIIAAVIGWRLWPSSTPIIPPPTTTPATTTPAPTQPTTALPLTSSTIPVQPPTVESKVGGTLRIVSSHNINNLGYPQGGIVNYPYYCLERLVVFAPDVWETQEFQGVLARSWECTSDMETWTFYLREGVRFHDGYEWDAEAAKWNLDLYKEEGFYYALNDMTSAEIIDKYTIRLNFESPKPFLMVDLATSIFFISSTTVLDNGKEWAIANPVGTGPYKLTKIDDDILVRYERFDDYWAGSPLLDVIEYIYIADPVTAKMAMEAGEADVYIFSEFKNTLDLEAEGFNVRYCRYHYLYGIWPSAIDADSIYYDKRVREALEYAINREAIVEAIAPGSPGYEAIYQASIPGDPAYREGWGRKYNPEKARQLLEEAGMPDGFDTTLYVNVTDEFGGDMAVMIVSWLDDIGINVTVEHIPPGLYYEYLFSGWPADTLLMSQVPYGPIYTHSAAYHYGCLSQELISNDYLFSKPQTPAMCTFYSAFEKALLEYSSYNDLINAYVDLSCQAMNDAVGIYIINRPITAVFHPNVHSDWFTYSPYVWNANESWLEEY